jgi:hypothetical protein
VTYSGRAVITLDQLLEDSPVLRSGSEHGEEIVRHL